MRNKQVLYLNQTTGWDRQCRMALCRWSVILSFCPFWIQTLFLPICSVGTAKEKNKGGENSKNILQWHFAHGINQPNPKTRTILNVRRQDWNKRFSFAALSFGKLVHSHLTLIQCHVVSELWLQWRELQIIVRLELGCLAVAVTVAVKVDGGVLAVVRDVLVRLFTQQLEERQLHSVSLVCELDVRKIRFTSSIVFLNSWLRCSSDVTCTDSGSSKKLGTHRKSVLHVFPEPEVFTWALIPRGFEYLCNNQRRIAEKIFFPRTVTNGVVRHSG